MPEPILFASGTDPLGPAWRWIPTTGRRTGSKATRARQWERSEATGTANRQSKTLFGRCAAVKVR